MNTFVSALAGLGFGLVGTITVFLMFHLWGYPFDKATRTSAAPRWAMRTHRAFGFLYVAIYLFMMWHMVPRLFHYQVEFPARTVAHIMLATTIGFILIVKISIIRFFRHLEEWMPFLGTGLLLCTYLLLALSVPFSFRERQLRRNALGGDVMSAQNLERVKTVLPLADFPAEAPIADLATEANISAGQQVLLTKCVECHDLKTVLTKPRTPKDWVQTVQRMAEKPVFGDAITDKQQWAVATYLIAITPELQMSVKKKRAQAVQEAGAKRSQTMEMEAPQEQDAAFDVAKVKPLFNTKCSQCHELDDVKNHKWAGAADAKEIMQRMVDNGLEASPKELEDLRQYLVAVYAKSGAGAVPETAPAAPSPAPAAATADNGDTAPAAAPAKGAKGSSKASSAAASNANAAAAPEAAPAAAPAADEGPTCGKKPLPDCPLQAWMKSNAVSASASGDLAALASVLDRTARMAPPGYGAWAQIASDGANAARSGDLATARASCGNCHGQYRAKYKAEMRARPLH